MARIQKKEGLIRIPLEKPALAQFFPDQRNLNNIKKFGGHVHFCNHPGDVSCFSGGNVPFVPQTFVQSM